MSTLFCTAKYRALFDLPDLLPVAESEPNALLGPWYANTLFIGPQRYLHYMSDRTLLPIVIWLRDSHTAEERFRRSLAELLRETGVPDAAVAAELEALTSLAYARATNPSRLSSMRDQLAAAKHGARIGPESSPWEITLRLASRPLAALEFRTPIEYAAETLSGVVIGRFGGG